MDREEAIEALGQEVFYGNCSNDCYKDIPVPFCFVYLFNSFLEMYNMSNEGAVTFDTIKNWCILRNSRLTQYELDIIELMKSWMSDEVSKLKDEAFESRKKETEDVGRK